MEEFQQGKGMGRLGILPGSMVSDPHLKKAFKNFPFLLPNSFIVKTLQENKALESMLSRLVEQVSELQDPDFASGQKEITPVGFQGFAFLNDLKELFVSAQSDIIIYIIKNN